MVLTLVNGRGRKRVELEDFSPALRVQGNSMWANGTLGLKPREVEQLYAGELSVNVATASSSSVVRGRLVPRAVADALDARQPLLFQRLDAVTNSLGGMAWVSVNSDCELQYDVRFLTILCTKLECTFFLYLANLIYFKPLICL